MIIVAAGIISVVDITSVILIVLSVVSTSISASLADC
jgi:hypothetical protein